MCVRLQKSEESFPRLRVVALVNTVAFAPIRVRSRSCNLRFILIKRLQNYELYSEYTVDKNLIHMHELTRSKTWIRKEALTQDCNQQPDIQINTQAPTKIDAEAHETEPAYRTDTMNSAPPDEGFFNTNDEALSAMKECARVQGYSIVRRSSRCWALVY